MSFVWHKFQKILLEMSQFSKISSNISKKEVLKFLLNITWPAKFENVT